MGETHAIARSHALRIRRLLLLAAWAATVDGVVLLDTSLAETGAYPGGLGICVLGGWISLVRYLRADACPRSLTLSCLGPYSPGGMPSCPAVCIDSR